MSWYLEAIIAFKMASIRHREVKHKPRKVDEEKSAPKREEQQVNTIN